MTVPSCAVSAARRLLFCTPPPVTAWRHSATIFLVSFDIFTFCSDCHYLQTQFELFDIVASLKDSEWQSEAE